MQAAVTIGVIGNDQTLNLLTAEAQVTESRPGLVYADEAVPVSVELIKDRLQLNAPETRVVKIHKQLELCAFARKGEHNVYSLVPNIAVCMYIYILIPSLAMTTMCIFLYSVNIGN